MNPKLIRLAFFSLVIFAFAAIRTRIESSVIVASATMSVGLIVGLLILLGFILRRYRYLALAFIYVALFGILELLIAVSLMSTNEASPLIVALALGIIPVAVFAMHGHPRNLG